MDETFRKLDLLLRDPGVPIDATTFIFALTMSTFVGLLVAGLYQVFYQDRATGSQVHRCFPLMAPSITTLFVAIQFSLPLSLGLLGALSIVRFRTPIKEPEEIGFIMLLIATSVVCATFQFLLLGALLAVATAVLAAQRYLPYLLASKRQDGIVLLTTNGTASGQARDQLLAALRSRLPGGAVQGVSYADDLTTVQYTFSGAEPDRLDGLHAALNQITPVQKLNIFFNRHGALS